MPPLNSNRAGNKQRTRRRKPAPHSAHLPRPLGPVQTARTPSPDATESAVLELTESHFATLDTGGRIRACAPAWQRHLHRCANEIEGRPLADLVEAADRPLLRNRLRRLLCGQPVGETTVRIPRPGASTLWIALSLRLTRDHDAINILARDVTAERQNRPVHTVPLEHIVDEIAEGVAVAGLTPTGPRITAVNSAFLRIFECDREQAIGTPLDFTAGPKTDEKTFQLAIERAVSGHTAEAELCLHRTAGQPVWVKIKLCPIFGPDEDVQQIIAIHQDVTEHHIALEALRRKNRDLIEALQSLQKTNDAIVQRERMHALGEMASGIAHDFNNLLSPILGFAELLLSMPDLLRDPEKVQGYMSKIRTAATDGAAVVARLREFYRARSEQEKPVEFSIQDAVRETLELTRHRWCNEAQAQGRHIEIVTDLQETPRVYGSVSEIRQALTNLVLNATDAMPRGGTLRLQTHAVGHWVCVQVADTGIGMSEDVRQRCMEPFFTTKGEAGTGLGLAMVFGTAERHNGRVEIDSEPGKGTTITLRLPAADISADAGSANTIPFPRSTCRALRVLLVDDEELLLEAVSQMLLSMGHRVDTCKDPRKALEKYYKNSYDLVITDRAMPGMSGDQLARAIREFHPDASIVLLTGFGNFIRESGEQIEGIDLLLSKPLSLQTLRETLERFGGSPSPREPVA